MKKQKILYGAGEMGENAVNLQWITPSQFEAISEVT